MSYPVFMLLCQLSTALITIPAVFYAVKVWEPKSVFFKFYAWLGWGSLVIHSLIGIVVKTVQVW